MDDLASAACTTPIAATNVRFIKLGKGGKFAQFFIDEGLIGLSFREVPHDLCASGNWDGVAAWMRAEGKSAQVSSNHVRELKDFYTLGPDTLWLTFANVDVSSGDHASRRSLPKFPHAVLVGR